MIIYVSGKSQNHIGYTVDWIAFEYGKDKNEKLTLNIDGTQDYKADTLEVKIKTSISPWEYSDLSNNVDEDLFELSEEEVMQRFSENTIVNIIASSHNVIIGLYPYNEKKEENFISLVQNDKLNDLKACIYIKDKKFIFENLEFEVNEAYEFQLN